MFSEEELKAMGLSDELVKSVIAQQNQKIKNYVLKSNFDNLQNELQKEKEKVSERDKQIKELNGFKGTNDELTEKVTKMQKELKEKDDNFKSELKKEKLKNAIRLEVMNLEQKPHDVDMIIGMLNTDKIMLADDGKLSGLDEQIKSLQKDKAFLFADKKSNEGNNNPFAGKFFYNGMTPPDGKKNKEESETSESIGKMFAANKLRMMGVQLKKEE